MKSIRHLIFDLDGTLIDSSDGVVEAVNYSLRMMGEPEQTPERIKPYIGYPLGQMYPEFTGAPIAELYHHFQVRAAKTVVASTVRLEGVEESLWDLNEAGYMMAIATTKIRKHTDDIIAKFGWEPLFHAVVGGDEVDRVKPDPEAFALALKRMGAEPEDSIVIGDTVNDFLAARGVPMKVIGVTSVYGKTNGGPDVEPDFFVESVGKLPAWLRNNGRGGSWL